VQVRYILYHESLWRIGARAFNAAVPAGLPALAAAAAAGEDTATSWEALADVLEMFLLGANTLVAAPARQGSDAGAPPGGAPPPEAAAGGGGPPPAPGDPPLRGDGAPPAAGEPAAAAPQAAAAPPPLDAQQARQDAELEAAVLDCLADTVLTQCGAAPLAMKRRLVSIVDRGAARPRQLNVQQVGWGAGGRVLDMQGERQRGWVFGRG
jgi:hypothetical protein